MKLHFYDCSLKLLVRVPLQKQAHVSMAYGNDLCIYLKSKQNVYAM